MRMILIAALVLVAACGRQDEPEATDERATVSRGGATGVGRIYHYVRSNIDGTEKEDVYVFRKSEGDLEVYKAREKCTNAALVSAKLDLNKGYATRIVGGRLLPQAERHEFAFFDFDAGTRTIRARVEVPDGPILTDAAMVEDIPWHLYDFDFASLTVMTPAIEPRADFAFGLALVIADPNRADFLQYLGKAEATYRKDEARNGHAAHRYVLGGPAFGAYGGSLWLDAEEGHILDVETGIPNHLEYRDFKLELKGVDGGGASAWRDLLAAHFEGCAT